METLKEASSAAESQAALDKAQTEPVRANLAKAQEEVEALKAEQGKVAAVAESEWLGSEVEQKEKVDEKEKEVAEPKREKEALEAEVAGKVAQRWNRR